MIALAAALAAATPAAARGPVDFTAQTMRLEPRDRRARLDTAVRLSRDGMAYVVLPGAYECPAGEVERVNP